MTQNTKRKFKYLIALLIPVSLIGGFLYFQFSKSESAQAAWFDESWLYRQKTEITNSSSAQTDFQVLITLDTATLITASKIQSDCDDIRITDINGKLLSHWLEPSTCNTSTSKIWAKVPSIPTTGATVYIYYGNPSASSVSSPTNTFIREISGVQGAWNMDETSWTNDCSTNTALDSSGNSNHGKSCPASTGPNTTSTAQFGRAGSFDGTDDYVDIGSGYGSNLDKTFTMELWVKPAATLAANATLLRSYISGPDGFYFQRNGSADEWIFAIINTNSQAYWNKAPISYDSWQHLVVVGDRTTLAMYKNGSLSESGILGGSFNWSRTTYMGGVYSSIYPLNGLIDEVRIYNKALSAAEISDLYGTGGDRQGYVTTNYPNKSLVRKYSASVSVGSPASEERGPGPVAYWKFDEGYGQTANDTTLNNNDGTLGSTSGSDTNDPTWQTEDMCVSGKCLKFDGTDDYVNAGNAASLNITGDITVETWIKAPLPTSDRFIFAKSDGVNFDSYSSYIPANTGRIAWEFTNGGGWNYSGSWMQSNSVVADNTWKFISLVRTSNSLKIYINGVLDNSYTIAVTPDTTSANLNFGRRGTTQYFNGLIDDVRIYPYARTAAQIKADYLARGASKGVAAQMGGLSSHVGDRSLSDGLVAWWKMDESSWTNDCSTATVTDSSGAGNHAKSCPASTGPNTTSTAKFAKAGSFDGTDDYVDAGNASSLNITNKFTISFWLKQNNSNGGIISKPHYSTGFDIHSGSGYMNVRSSGFNVTDNYFSTGLSDNVWGHIVITFDSTLGGNNLLAYVNGTLKAGFTRTGGFLSNSSNLVIGKYVDGDVGWWEGIIDEVHIYNRALSPKEVRDLYNWAPGPVAYWNMDEKTGQSANDSSGSGNTGTLGASSGVDSSDPTWVTGKIGAGLQFDGNDDYVSISNPFPFSTIHGPSTVEAWFKASSILSSWRPIFSDNCLEWGIYLNEDSTIRGAAYSDINGGTISTGQWYHAAVTHEHPTGLNNTKIKFYLNGVLKGESTYTITTENGYNDAPFWIGADGCYPGHEFNGSIDDVRIYNYARTQKQIIEDMNAGHPAGGSPVGSQMGYWKFDEGYGGTAQDSSPQNNDGTLYPGSGGTNTATAQMWSNSAKFGKAMEFDGTDDYVDVGDPVSLDITSAITLEAWVYKNSDVNWQRILQKTASVDYALLFDNTGKVYTQMNIGGTTETVYSDSSLDIQRWYHVVAKYDGSKVYLYINGIKQSYENLASGTITTSSGNLNIGRDPFPAGYFNGLIDEVKIYNYALTEDEIKLEYNRGAAVHLGSVSTASDGTTPSYSSDRSYCIPGDTSTCNPPVAEWTFNEKTGQSTQDTSGNGNTGTLGSSGGSDSSDPTWVSAKIGAGLQFDGSNDYVDAGNGASLRDTLNGITIETWIYPTNYSGHNSDQWYLVVKGSYPNSGWYLQLRNGGYPYFMTLDGTEHGCYGCAGTVPLNQWTHLVGWSNGTTDKIFINGVEKASWNSGTLTASNASLIIAVSDPDYTFNGSIDEVRIYNYARTPAQIAWDYNRGKPVAHWKFDECQGATAYDASGNANHGTITIGASGTQTGIGTCTDANSANARYNGRNGKYNSALNFDGTDDYVDIAVPDGSVLDNTFEGSEISLSWWFNIREYPVGIADKFWEKSGQAHRSWIQPTTNKFEGVLYGVTGNWSWSVSGPSLNTWYFAAVTKQGDTLKVYVNGSLQQTVTGTNENLKSALGGFYISHPTETTTGLIDEVKIFNYALTPQQIKNEYNEGAAIRFGPSTGSP